MNLWVSIIGLNGPLITIEQFEQFQVQFSENSHTWRHITAKRQKGNYRSDASQLAPGISIVIWWFFVFLHHFRDLETLCRYLKTATKQLKTVKFSKRGVHKRRHQSRGRRFAKRWSYLINLFSKNDDEGGGRVKKSQNIDDVFYERPLTTCYFSHPQSGLLQSKTVGLIWNFDMYPNIIYNSPYAYIRTHTASAVQLFWLDFYWIL